MIGRSHLRVVSDRYDGTVVDGKSSISIEDARVIDMLIDYHVAIEEFEMAGLLSEWKSTKDSKFVDKVRSFTNYDQVDHLQEPTRTEGEEEDLSPTFITFEGSIFNVNQISLIKVSHGWSVCQTCNMFYVEINSREQHPDRGQVVRKEFRKEEQRDVELDKLKQKLISYGVKFI